MALNNKVLGSIYLFSAVESLWRLFSFVGGWQTQQNHNPPPTPKPTDSSDSEIFVDVRCLLYKRVQYSLNILSPIYFDIPSSFNFNVCVLQDSIMHVTKLFALSTFANRLLLPFCH